MGIGNWILLAIAMIMFVILSIQTVRLNKRRTGYNLNLEDLDFLIELQHEMLTQDHVGQAAPRFWVIQGTRRAFCGSEYGTDGEVLCQDSEEYADGLEEAIEYFTNNYEAKLEEANVSIEKDNVLGGYIVKHMVIDKDGDDLSEERNAWTVDELIEALEEFDVIDSNAYSSACYKLEDYIYPDTLFLTNRSCKEHIRLNYYHYSSDAHSYAMTAWRSPEVKKLWEILDKIDWEAIKKEVIHGTNATKSSDDT